jgi:hypothetical protein
MSEQLTTASAYDVLAEIKNRGAAKYADKNALAQVTKVGDYLPYLGILQATSSEVKEHGLPMGEFVFCKSKQKTPIGKSMIAMILSWRPKAMQYQPKVLSYYDPNSDAFKKIEADSAFPNSNKGFGPEFLLWLPDIEGGTFASFFFGNPTGRVEAPNLIAAFDKGILPFRLTSELIKDTKKNNSWFGPRYHAYELAITNHPSKDELLKVVDKFNNPPVTEAEEADDKGSDRG